LLEAHEQERARAAYRRAAELRPGDPAPLRGLAALSESDEEAIAILSQALELDRESAVTWDRLGAALYSSGEHEKALAAVMRATELDPDDGNAWFNRGRYLR